MRPSMFSFVVAKTSRQAKAKLFYRFLGKRRKGAKLKAVGWLACGHSYTLRQIQLPETRFCQLLRLLVNPWEPFQFMDGILSLARRFPDNLDPFQRYREVLGS